MSSASLPRPNYAGFNDAYAEVFAIWEREFPYLEAVRESYGVYPDQENAEFYVENGGRNADIVQAFREKDTEWFLRIAKKHAENTQSKYTYQVFWHAIAEMNAERLDRIMPWKAISRLYAILGVNTTIRVPHNIYNFNQVYAVLLRNLCLAFNLPLNQTLETFHDRAMHFPLEVHSVVKDVPVQGLEKKRLNELGLKMLTLPYVLVEKAWHESADLRRDIYIFITTLPFISVYGPSIQRLWDAQILSNAGNRKILLMTWGRLIQEMLGAPTMIDGNVVDRLMQMGTEVLTNGPQDQMMTTAADGTRRPNYAFILPQAAKMVREIEKLGLLRSTDADGCAIQSYMNAKDLLENIHMESLSEDLQIGLLGAARAAEAENSAQ